MTASVEASRERPAYRLRRRNTAAKVRTGSSSNADRLATASGNISIRARVRKRLHLPGRTQRLIALRAGAYVEALDDYDAALAALLPIHPDALVDTAFPGDHETKFERLNGWQKPKPGNSFRTAYRRARRFLNPTAWRKRLRFDASATRSSGSSLEVLLDGSRAARVLLGNGWREVSASLAAIPPRSRFVCELRVTSPRPSAEFEVVSIRSHESPIRLTGAAVRRHPARDRWTRTSARPTGSERRHSLAIARGHRNRRSANLDRA